MTGHNFTLTAGEVAHDVESVISDISSIGIKFKLRMIHLPDKRCAFSNCGKMRHIFQDLHGQRDRISLNQFQNFK